jgi:hypothetical protein
MTIQELIQRYSEGLAARERRLASCRDAAEAAEVRLEIARLRQHLDRLRKM